MNDLEMRSSWMIQVNPKFSSKCLYKRQREIQRREGNMKVETEMSFAATAKKCLEKLEEGGKHFLLGPPEGVWPHQHLDFGCRPPEPSVTNFLLFSTMMFVVTCYNSSLKLIRL